MVPQARYETLEKAAGIDMVGYFLGNKLFKQSCYLSSLVENTIKKDIRTGLSCQLIFHEVTVLFPYQNYNLHGLRRSCQRL